MHFIQYVPGPLQLQGVQLLAAEEGYGPKYFAIGFTRH